MRRLAAMLALSAIAAPLRAETVQDAQVWLNATAMGSISGPLVYFAEVQPRFVDSGSRLGQLIVRPAIGWTLSPRLTVYQGYAHVVLPMRGRRDVNEERSFQQATWTIGKLGAGTLSSRTRLEQRWRSDGDGMAWRIRELIRYAHPAGRPIDGGRRVNALGYVEGFAALNETAWGVRSGFDQTRTFLGLELPFGLRSTVEAGYLNQLVRRTGGRIDVNHVASVTAFVRH